MRKLPVIATLCLLTLIAATVAWAVEVEGRVVNEDGEGQAEVKVEFFGDNLYSAWTEEDGTFTIDNVQPGTYKVKVTGSKEQTFDVTVGSEGMTPNPLIVSW